MGTRPVSWVMVSLSAFATLCSAAGDFTGMTDLEVLMHKDRNAALAEFAERAKDYPPEKVREIEQAYFKLRMTPREHETPAVEEILGKINVAPDSVERATLFETLQEVYEAADSGEKANIRTAFVEAWANLPYPETYDTGQIEAMLRYREYAHETGRYFTTEDTLMPLLVERCLEMDAYDRYNLFVGELVRARVALGPLAAEWAERLYTEVIERREEYFLSSNRATLQSQLLRILGRAGKPGLQALLRLGREDSEDGIWSLGINPAPEAEALLWELYESKDANQDETRLKILRAIASKKGAPVERAGRREHIRQELTPYLKLPQGRVEIGNIQDAVALAKDTGDPYYLPHVEALESAFFALDPKEYHTPGMEGRMDEALENLRERFAEAKARLERVSAAGAPEE